jgi:large subunit ribosomal protein L5e
MGFVKIVKNKAYYKRFQVKLKRRREGKTDYRARRRLINQDKNKYNTPKYRFVVRISNREITAQIAYAQLTGDKILCSAYSHELKRYGLKAGFTNYASSYATGLLLARRLLAQLGLAEKYLGVKEATGEDKHIDYPEEGPRPFKALLDVGLARTSTGARVFAVLKGALDGGVDVPHKETRFAGYKKDTGKLDAALFRKYIFGGHVADYMKLLEKDNPERYKRQFGQYIKNNIKAGDIEGSWKKIHVAIRADPARKKVEKKPGMAADAKKKSKRRQPLTLAQRKDRVRQKFASKAKKVGKQ